MSNEHRQILNMLADGKITSDEAEELLASLSHSHNQTGEGGEAKGTHAKGKTRPKYLRVVVDGREKGEQVNIRIPFLFLRSGMKLASILPGNLSGCVIGTLEKEGVKLDFKRFKAEDLEELVDQLAELDLNIEEGGEKIRIFCE